MIDDSDADPSRSPKRRRIRSDSNTPQYSSSPDELWASNDHGASGTPRRTSTNHRDYNGADPGRHSVGTASEGSTDELHRDHRVRRNSSYRDVESWSRSRRQSRTQSPPAYSALTPEAETPPPKAQPSFVPYKQKMLLRGHRRGVAAVRISPNGKLIASCSADATIRIWDLATGKSLHVLEGHLAGVSTITWSPDSETLASGSDDKSIRLWNVQTGKPYPNALLGHHNYIYSIAFSPKGNMLVSGSYDEAVFIWDVRAARIIRSLPAHSDPVGGVDFIRDGTLIASCASDGLIRIWDTTTGQCLRTLVHEDNAPVTSVRFSPNGRFVLAWTLDSCVRLWNYVEGRCVKTYQGHSNKKFSLSGAFGAYGGGEDEETRAFAVSGSEDGGLVCWDVINKEVLQRIGGHDDCVLGVDIGDGGIMVSGGLDKTVRIWDIVAPGHVGGEVDKIDGDGQAMKEEPGD